MSEITSNTPRAAPIGTATVPIEDVGNRLFLREEVATGTTRAGDKIEVSVTIGGTPALYIRVGDGRYLVSLGAAIDAAVVLHGQRAEVPTQPEDTPTPTGA